MTRVFLFLFPVLLLSQETDFLLNWSGTTKWETENKILQLPNPAGYQVFFDDSSEEYMVRIKKKIQNSEASLSFYISDVQHEEVSASALYDLDQNKLPQAPEINHYTTKSRDKNNLIIVLNPFFVENSKIFRIHSFKISSKRSKKGFQDFDQNPLTESQMASIPEKGYRFEVDKTGIYKLNGRFLKRLGVDLESIDPTKLKIFGRGGQMLPLVNSESTDVGMFENPLMLVGVEDGSFENDDYILFYATGSDRWNQDSETFNNIFQDESHYIVSFGEGQGKRVQLIPNVQQVSESNISAKVVLHHEKDLVNIAKMGRRWLGESLVRNSQKEFAFNLTNIEENSSAILNVSGAAVSSNSSQMSVVAANVNQSISFLPTQNLSRATYSSKTFELTPEGNQLNVSLNYQSQNDNSAIAYLDHLRLEYNRKLTGSSGQFSFSPEVSGTYSVSDADAVWEQTPSGEVRVYLSDQDAIAFEPFDLGSDFQLVSYSDTYTPLKSSLGDDFQSENIREQLASEVEYIIVADKAFKEEAQRLADHHINFSGLQTLVLTLDQIYDEFNAGNTDISAIRNAIRYAYHSNPDKLKYVCLFGDTSYDYKNRTSNVNNIVPTFHAINSFHVANSYMSDDFYAMMDVGEGSMGFLDEMDLAVGRMLFDTPVGARSVVNKAIEYCYSYGDWQNSFTLLSDDPDKDWEVTIQQELDKLGDVLAINKPFINVTKIHSDAYQQQVTAGGDRYPEVNEALENKISQGTLVVNYFGHGGEEGLASEFIFDKNLAQRLYHPGRYPLFVTSTCEFSRFDNHNLLTAGEMTYANPSGGAIGLISTTRQIYVTNGINYNNILSKHLFAFGSDDYPSMAEALRRAKAEFSGTSQKRIVFYIGDPALRLAVPGSTVNLTKFNGTDLDELTEDQKQLRALDKVLLSGEVLDPSGTLSSSFNGEAVVTIFDKSIEKTTLSNNGHGKMVFDVLGNVIFKGNTLVSNGLFEIELVIPKDISLPLGNARISLYAYDAEITRSVTGYSNDLTIGGLNPNPAQDNTGPEINVYLDNRDFNSGDQTGKSPMLLVDLFDENGMNTSGGLGHELLAVIDGVSQNPIILNNYYKTDFGDYRSGEVTYLLNDLSPGPHSLTITAWDTFNNPSTRQIDFVVSDSNQINIEKLYTVPNPFRNQTRFWIEHNKSREPLEATLVVHDIMGKKVWEHQQTIFSGDTTNSEILWDGRSSGGGVLNKGVYLGTIILKSSLSGTSQSKSHRIIIE
ncbi:MAG: type IX secretion system sortase PorU [Flavobacteriaceae bacterium]|nr:type IX secretion system sortase PorU [Flavobacteriaceae bacterium]